MFKDSQEVIKSFTIGEEGNQKDYLLRENSNFVYSLPLLRHNIDNYEEEKYLMDNIFTKEIKKLHEEGVVYIHDKKLAPYCNSLSCLTIAGEGIPTLAKNMLSSKPTNKVGTFFRMLSNATVLLSQQTSGAVMLSQMTTVIAGYLYYNSKVKNIEVSYGELKDLFFNLIWELNLPLRSGSQSSFSNLTLEFGKPSEEIKKEAIIVGGDFMREKYEDIPTKYFDIINKAFIDAMAKGSGNGIPFTFPLITVPIVDGFDHKNKMYLYLLENMDKWGGCYFENFTTEAFKDKHYSKLNPLIKPRDPEVSRSLCPLDGNEEVVYYSYKKRQFVSSPIKNLYYNLEKSNEDYKLFLQNGKVIEGKINIFNETEYAEITLSNNLKIKTTLNHLNKTLRGNEISTSELTTEDYLPFSREKIVGSGLSYEDGLLVGAFIGDGSYLTGKNGICLSLHKETDLEFISQIIKIVEDNYGGYVSQHPLKSKCVNVNLYSNKLVGLIKDFVNGDNALNKSLNLKSINKSLRFREGIVKGLYQTDGGNNNRIYTSSINLVKSLSTLFSSLGTTVNITEDNRDGRLSDNVCYTVRWYQPGGVKKQYKDVYKLDDNFMWFKIKDIKYYSKNKNTNAYCVEVLDNSDPYFMMSNGILTHNCRLNIDLSLLSKVGGGIFGSSTGNTGAVQVLNINLNRILMEYKYEFGEDIEKLKERIRQVMEVLQDNHQRKRKWILSNKNLYPTFFAYNEDLRNYFNVFAISAMHEGLINIGYKEGLNCEKGKEFAHKIMQYIHTIIDEFVVRDKVACGIEFAPNENAGVKLARHDLEYGKEKGINVFVQGDVETKEVYTTSGCMLPFSEEDFLKQLENSAEFQSYGTSGSIFHQFLEDKVEPEVLAEHIQRVFKKPIIYTTISTTSSSCMNCGQRFIGVDGIDIESCPKCESDDIATFSRVIGYTKMISRGNIKNKKGKYQGDFNFWSNARRRDWSIRKRVKGEDFNEVLK